MKSKPSPDRLRTFLKRGLLAAVLVYGAVVFFPQLAFAHVVEYENFRVYTTQPVGSEEALSTVLDDVNARLAAVGMDDAAVGHRIFLTPDRRWFRFFSPASPHAFAINRSFVHNVIVNTSDIEANAVRTDAERHGERTLSGVLAHELTHTLLAHRFGQVRMLQGDNMRQEGYCDYVAQETSFDTARGMELLRDGARELSASFAYFRWSVAVEHLVEVEGASLEDVLFGEWDIEEVLDRAVPPDAQP